MKTFICMSFITTALLTSGFRDTGYRQIFIRENFSRISIKGDIKVILIQNRDDSVLKYKDGSISAAVENGELVVRKKNGFFSNRQPFVIIPVNQLQALKITDEASVFTQGILQTSELYIDHKGNGVIKLSVAADNVFVCSRGKGKIQIEGNYKQTLARQDETGCMIIEYSNKEK